MNLSHTQLQTTQLPPVVIPEGAHPDLIHATCPQPFHQMTSSLSPVSSRDLTIIWGISRVGGAPPPA